MFNRRDDADLAEDLETFFQLLVDEKVRAGMPLDRARRAARLEVGGATQIREAVNDLRPAAWFASLARDLRYALRSLRRSPSFTAIVVTTLALGLGATTAIFGAVEAVVLRPFAGGDASRQVVLLDRFKDVDENVSAGDFIAWHARSRTFAHMGAEQYRNITVVDNGSANRLLAGFVTGDFFAATGARPLVGRGISDADAADGHQNVVVLSEGVWRRQYAADPGIVGRSVQINGQSYAIIGVVADNYNPTLSGEALWLPLVFDAMTRADHDMHFLAVIGQLRDGATLAQSRSELDGIAHQLRSEFPQTNAQVGVTLVPLRESNLGGFETRLYVMLGAVLLVLLIACGNVSNLLLARGSARGKELALRAAIGAGRGQIIRQLLCESLLLALGGCVAGLVVAEVALRAFVRYAPPNLPRLELSRLDPMAISFAVAIALVCSVIFGLMPALRAARGDLQSALREGGRSSSGSAKDAIRVLLIGGEVALAMTLLAGAGLLIRSAINLQRVNAGFNVRGVLTARVALPPLADSNANAMYEATFTRLSNDLQRSPAIAGVGLASQIPMFGGGTSNGVIAEGKPRTPDNGVQSFLHVVTPGYFRALGIPVRGESFTGNETHDTPRVIILSATAAKRLFPSGDAIGKHVYCCQDMPNGAAAVKLVIGIAGDVRSAGPAGKIESEFYLPLAQIPPDAWGWMNHSMSLVLRPRNGTPESLTPIVRTAVANISTTIPVFAVATMEENLGRTIADARFNTLLLGSLGALGLVLAAVGIYSVIGYFVAQRTAEIGIRMALGASAGEVVGLLTRQGMRPVLVGAAVGTGAALWLARVLTSLLFDVAPTDPATFVLVIAVLLATALAATIVPARRASHVDGIRTLMR